MKPQELEAVPLPLRIMFRTCLRALFSTSGGDVWGEGHCFKDHLTCLGEGWDAELRRSTRLSESGVLPSRSSMRKVARSRRGRIAAEQAQMIPVLVSIAVQTPRSTRSSVEKTLALLLQQRVWASAQVKSVEFSWTAGVVKRRIAAIMTLKGTPQRGVLLWGIRSTHKPPRVKTKRSPAFCDDRVMRDFHR